jgi:hypothetical protein
MSHISVRLSVDEAGATSVSLASQNLLDSVARAIASAATLQVAAAFCSALNCWILCWGFCVLISFSLLQAAALPAFAFRCIMKWLDREFWSLFKKVSEARAAAPPSAAHSLSSAGIATVPASDLKISGIHQVASSIRVAAGAADEWSSDEQRRLESALVAHPSSLDPKQRWLLISADVRSKTAGQCIARFKYIRDALKCGGSVSVPGAKAPPMPSSSSKDPPAKLAPALPAVASSTPSSDADSVSSMPPAEIPDDLLTMTGVIAGAGVCAGGRCSTAMFQVFTLLV